METFYTLCQDTARRAVQSLMDGTPGEFAWESPGGGRRVTGVVIEVSTRGLEDCTPRRWQITIRPIEAARVGRAHIRRPILGAERPVVSRKARVT